LGVFPSPFFTVRDSDMKTSAFSNKILGQDFSSTPAESWSELKVHLSPNWRDLHEKQLLQ